MLALSGPIVLTNLGQVAIQTTDVVMIGWLGTQLEVSRRLRTDPEFAARWAARAEAVAAATRERLARQREAGTLRDDITSR